MSLLHLLRFSLKTSLGLIRLHPLLYFSGAFVFMVMLTLLTAGYLAFKGADDYLSKVGEGSKAIVVLEDSLPDAEIQGLSSQICRSDVTESCTLQTADIVQARFLKNHPDLLSLVESLKTSPFPRVIEVQLTQNASISALQIEQWSKNAQNLQGVKKVIAGLDWLRTLSFVKRMFFWVLATLSILFGLVLMALITFEVVSFLQFQKLEMEIMHLMGASKTTMILPYVIQSLIMAFLSVIGLALVYVYATVGLKNISIAPLSYTYFMMIGGSLSVLCAITSSLAAYSLLKTWELRT